MPTRDVYTTGFDEQHGKTIDADTCPECSGTLQTDGGEVRCGVCGLVVETYRIDHGPAHYTSSENRTRERTGAPLTPTRHDEGLSTEIGRFQDANGNPLSARKRRQLGRLRKQQQRGRWRNKQERNLGHGLGDVRRMTSALGLPDSIRDQACVLFRRAQDADLLPGRSIEAMTAASVYAACRVNGRPQSRQAVGAVAQVSLERVENAYSVLNRELELPTVPPHVRDYIPGIVSALALPAKTQRRAEIIAEKAMAEGVGNGKHPAGVAAACLYLAAQQRGPSVTQARLAECADVSTATLRARLRELQALPDVE